MTANRGPFDQPSVGFSDSVLLLASLAGFAMLAVTMYSLILMRLRSVDESADDKAEAELDYDEALEAADVSTLTRAQRRLRAKNRMKKQRRVAPETSNSGPQANQHGDGSASSDSNRHLTRKERQKAAKAAEKEERRLFETERREQQRKATDAARQSRRIREQQEAERVDEERRKRKMALECKEEHEYQEWNTLIVTKHGSRLLVKDFVSRLKSERVICLDVLARELRVSTKTLEGRIRCLRNCHRLAGVSDGRGCFYYSDKCQMDKVVFSANIIPSKE